MVYFTVTNRNWSKDGLYCETVPPLKCWSAANNCSSCA